MANIVKDIITQFLQRDSTDLGGGSFKAAVHVLKPNASQYITIACAQEVVLPEYEVEAVLIEGGLGACDLFSGSGDSTIQFENYARTDTARLGEFTQDLYYTTDRLDLVQELSLLKEPVGIVIDIADSRRTQFAFRGFLTNWQSTFTARSDSSLTMISTTFRPTGAPFLTSGVVLNIGQDQSTAIITETTQ